MRRRPYRLLSIAHSYCVALNRRLANELARVGGADWEVTAVAPSFFHGDLREIAAEDYPGELCRLETVRTFLSRRIHFFFYASRLREVHARLGWNAEGPPVVGYLGRFVEEKGLAQLMRTLDQVRAPWRALLVGGGPLEPAIRAWAEAYGGRVRIATDVPHDGVAAYLN